MAATPGGSGLGGNQPPPVPLPPPHDLGTQVVGPLPVASVVPLPSLSHDHYGDGAGTVGAGLIWMGQLPHQYQISRFHDGDGKVGGPITHLQWITPHSKSVLTNAELGYGPPGLHPGFYGFGLSFRPGYGYGGNALGVGAYGGYPCYGGPGYPLHYGYPKFADPYFQGTAQLGQLYYDPPVVVTELMDAGDFGPFTGASSYAYTHPSYAAEAAATGSFMPGAAPTTPASSVAPEATITPPAAGTPPVDRVPVGERYLGMDVEPSADAGGRRGLRIVDVLPGSTAAKAGLQVGDIIYSINGNLTVRRGDLAGTAANAAPGSILKMMVGRASDGKEQTVTIQVP
jgi:hypothetical protein